MVTDNSKLYYVFPKNDIHFFFFPLEVGFHEEIDFPRGEFPKKVSYLNSTH